MTDGLVDIDTKQTKVCRTDFVFYKKKIVYKMYYEKTSLTLPFRFSEFRETDLRSSKLVLHS